MLKGIENYDICVVDNNSTDGSYEKLKEKLTIKYLIKSDKNDGYAAGHKISANIAVNDGYAVLWVLNNDLTVRENSLVALIDAYRMYPEGIFGSISIVSENPDIMGFGGGLTDDINKPFNYNEFDGWSLTEYQKKFDVHPVQSVEGSSIFIPVDIIKKHGFMAIDFFMYGEETDYCYRLAKLGIKSYVVPQSVVIHEGAKSFKGEHETSFISAYYRRRNYLYIAKNHFNEPITKKIKQQGFVNLLKFFIKYWSSGKKHKINNRTLYYINLANIHALLGRRGKTIKPENIDKFYL